MTGLLLAAVFFSAGVVSCASEEVTPPRKPPAVETPASLPQKPVAPSVTASVSPVVQTPPVPEVNPPRIYTVAEIVALLEPLVVRVETSGGTGSGIIISSSGYVLTNKHVVDNSSLVKVTLKNGKKYDAVVVAVDDKRDLAVAAIISDHSGFSQVAIGSSANVTVGEDVVAIGFALGLDGQVTISKGIISAVRDVEGLSYIQTDAPINPGNSGGPLVNLKGEVIGINAIKYVGTAVEGIGLAIPIDEAKSIIQKTTGR